MIRFSDEAISMVVPIIGASRKTFTSLGKYEDENSSGHVFVKETINAFKDNPFVLFEMAVDPKSKWSHFITEAALTLLISRCETLDSLVLLYYALPPDLTSASAEAIEGHPNDRHVTIVERMVDVCKDDPHKLWILFQGLKHVEQYRDLVAIQINTLASLQKPRLEDTKHENVS